LGIVPGRTLPWTRSTASGLRGCPLPTLTPPHQPCSVRVLRHIWRNYSDGKGTPSELRKCQKRWWRRYVKYYLIALTVIHELTLSVKSPWQELDKEVFAFKRHGPMGCLGSASGLEDFYGGKVSFSMRAQLDEQGAFHFVLERPALAHSSRFTRCYGSSFLIKLRLSLDLLSKPDLLNRLKQLLITPLVLLGQVFRFFHINKNHHAYLMATDELYNGGIISPPSNSQRISFLDFFRRHNNLEQNSNQVSHTHF
jgi:hypothetical protein